MPILVFLRSLAAISRLTAIEAIGRVAEIQIGTGSAGADYSRKQVMRWRAEAGGGLPSAPRPGKISETMIDRARARGMAIELVPSG